MNAPGKSTPATKGLVKRPRPAGMLYTIEAAAVMFHRRPRTIYDLLSVHAERFDTPMYEQAASRRLHRVLSARDIKTLRLMFPIYVKEKAPTGASLGQTFTDSSRNGSSR